MAVHRARSGRIGGLFSASRGLVRVAYRDPEHVSERLTLHASQSLGEPSRDWAQRVHEARPDAPNHTLAEEQRTQTAKIARIDGAVAGTPFLVALVPGYLSYLWQEERMTLRIAALYVHDPRELRTAAQMLVLRGVHPTVEAAEAALMAVRDRPLPEKPDARRPLRAWIQSVRMILVFGGFIAPPTRGPRQRSHGRLRAAAELALAGAIWVTTWVLPVTFMIAMSWACETHARQLGRRALVFYGGDAATEQAAIATADRRRDRGHDKRQLVRAIALFLSVAVPIGFVAYANSVRQSTGVNWLGALGALAALSLVIAAAIMGRRG
jgi:hypothetical protein